MSRTTAHRRRSFSEREKGFALMLLLLLLGVGAGAALFSYFSSAKLTLESDQKIADALARAKEALIAYAVKNGDIAGSARPGDFPCPDTKAPTDINYGTQDGSCSAGRLGRIPWKTLGIPEPKDASGETLWYASGAFRPDSSQPSTRPINSDRRGDITVFAADGTTQLTTQAVAVIFAPGPALGTQSRDPATALCPTTGTTIAQNRCAANYLEASAGVNNAVTNGPFIVGRLRDPNYRNYNDRVLLIATPEFMPAVEMRVARELKSLLAGYRANSICGCYPWADSFGAADGVSDAGVNRGRLPLTALPEDWAQGTIPALPSWVGNNNWYNVIYYSVAKLNSQEFAVAGPLVSCTTCVDNTLSVNGVAGVSALLFTPGTPLGAIFRPSNNLAHYLENAQNNDGANDLYVTPTATALDRDRLTTF